MALTTPTICGDGELPIARYAPWCLNNVENDANTAPVLLKAAPCAGQTLYLTHATFSGRLTDIQITLRDGDTDVLFGPIQMQANGTGTFLIDWEYPLRLTSNTGLYVYANAATAFMVYIEGFTGQDDI